MSVDEALGRIAGALEDTGRMSNTLFIFLSDHGLDDGGWLFKVEQQVYAGLAIYDTMQYIKPDVQTICVGMAMSPQIASIRASR